MTTIVNASEHDTTKPPQINSITRFLEKNNAPMLIQPSKPICAKGCGRGGRPPKSSTRFRSVKEQVVEKLISNKNRKCGGCGKAGYDIRQCTTTYSLMDDSHCPILVNYISHFSPLNYLSILTFSLKSYNFHQHMIAGSEVVDNMEQVAFLST